MVQEQEGACRCPCLALVPQIYWLQWLPSNSVHSPACLTYFFFFLPLLSTFFVTLILVCEYAARAFILGGFIITVSSCWHCLCISLELVCLAGFLRGQSCLQACSWGDGRKYLALKLSLGQTLHPCVSRGSRAIPPLLLGSYFTFEWYKGSLVPWCNGIMEKQWDVKLFSFLSR